MDKQTAYRLESISSPERTDVSVEAGNERGSAMVIALLIMILLMAFVAFAISRTNSETVAAGNDEAETKTYEAANASLEILTRNFNKIFETKLTIAPSDVTRIEGQYPPGFDNAYNFTQTVTQTQATRDVVMTGEMFQGLNARRDEWQLDSTATDLQSGVQVALRRKFLNNRIPIFQFGIFYDDDLEFHPGPRFDFGGRVHSNGSIFLMAQTGLYFSSKVSSANHIFTDVSKNNSPYTAWGDNVFIKNASGGYVQLRSNMGSVLQSVVNGSPVTTAPLPTAYTSANWIANQNTFQGNLLANTKPLQLPIKLNGDMTANNVDLVEIVKRGKNVGDLWNDGTGTVTSPSIVSVTAPTSDDKVTAAERYYNKTGMRVSLADSKAKLPGCANTSGGAILTPCGIRLDGESTGQTSGLITGVRGYLPRAMVGGYQATAVNGGRFNTGNKETWIKIETVVFNPATIVYDTQDITQDILSLGVTDAAQTAGAGFQLVDTGYTSVSGNDTRSIIKVQRFAIPGPAIPNTTGATGGNTFITSSNSLNYVQLATVSSTTSSNRCNNTAVTATTNPGNGGGISAGTNFFPGGFTSSVTEPRSVWKTASITGLSNKYGCVVPIPINIFDTREGLYNDSAGVFNPLTSYGSNVPWAGVMSLIDIDIANLKRFLDGNFNANMPTGTPIAGTLGRALRGSDVPQNNGWVLYVSDRRGDFDFDGEYDMEDVFGNNDGVLQAGEDINQTLSLQADYLQEAIRYTGAGNSISPDIAAVFDHKFYRRGVRLRNGQLPPGTYDSVTPSNTRGFTVASENGIYVQGNYNASGIASVGTPTASTDYLPIGANDIPCSIAADAVMPLSNAWTDARSFVSPFDMSSRNASETHQRYGMISGDTITSLSGTPNQGGGDLKMNGGVHNFFRFLEDWGSVRLNYAGSLINLFNSHNNNGTYKSGGNNVYNPPTRNWVFDATFLDVNRLPPGTPYFQSIQMTGFQRVN